MIRDYSKKLSVFIPYKLGDEKCWYCGEHVPKSSFRRTADHFYPKCLGGRLKVVCCKNCNQLKKDLTPNDFIKLIKKLKNRHSTNSSLQERFSRMINATETLYEKVKWSIPMENFNEQYEFNDDHKNIWLEKLKKDLSQNKYNLKKVGLYNGLIKESIENLFNSLKDYDL